MGNSPKQEVNDYLISRLTFIKKKYFHANILIFTIKGSWSLVASQLLKKINQGEIIYFKLKLGKTSTITV